jgi:hypothetical protein
MMRTIEFSAIQVFTIVSLSAGFGQERDYRVPYFAEGSR